jgi:hypothetical protein
MMEVPVMDNHPVIRLGARRRLTLLVTMASVAVLSIGVLPSVAEHGGPHLTVIQRATFSDDVSVKVKFKRDDQPTQVINTRDASDAVLATIVIPDGALAPWHTHAGPGFLLNTGPGTLTSVLSSDCEVRDYPPGSALIDPGHGTQHAAWNASGEEVVLYALFIGVGNGPVLPGSPPADCDVLP